MKQFSKYFTSLSKQEGEDVGIAIDASSSMGMEDLKPSRIQAAIKAIESLIDIKRFNYPNDRVTIVQFSSNAKTVHALTNVTKDYCSLKQSLKEIYPISSTNITAGLQITANNLNCNTTLKKPNIIYKSLLKLIYEDQVNEMETKDSFRARKIVLLSDGVHNVGTGPKKVAEEIKRQGIVVCVVGIGGSPNADEFNEKQLKKIASKDKSGNPMYCFISDTEKLIKKFQSLSHHIKPLEE